MKIGWVLPGALDDRDGSVRYDRLVVEGLRANGHEVEVVSLPRVSWFASLRDAAQRSARRRMASVRPDVWIEDANAHGWLHGAGAWSIEAPRIALVHHLRSDEGLPLPMGPAVAAVERRYLTSVRRHIYVSRTTRQRVERLAGRAVDHVIASPAGDLRGPRLSWSNRERRLTRRRTVRFLFVGSWSERKGLLPLLRACARLHRRDRSRRWSLRIVGEPGEAPGYTASVAEALRTLPARRVDLAGRLEGPALRRAYQNADLLVVPSLFEGFGMVYLEGQGFGLPAIAGSEGGARELVQHGVTGWLVPGGKVRPLEARLWQALNDPTALARMSRAAWANYDVWPTWTHTVERIEDLATRTVRGDGLPR